LNILFDTNVILDALLDREPFGTDAAGLFNAVEDCAINGLICANSVTTIFYLIRKGMHIQQARHKLRLLLELFEIAPVNRSVLENALNLSFADYEDSVVYQSAVSVNADGIVTRNQKDFIKSKIAVYSPVELLAAIHGR